ncbi:phage head-tail connector protein [Streptococcus thoraltensis]|uniref:phage head-tail connector protein n=1 Tax=Streptococcus thoraltensis TaxID=55085 RepID=UPI001F59535B|nr:phage head-tail connector protein [Streptococcus thoraltensis]
MTQINLDTTLENVKLDLNIEDNLQDSLLKLLINKVCQHFKMSYGVAEIDEKFDFIIEDCAIKRFNRRGSEGAKSESVEGHSVTYYDVMSEFEPYDDLIRQTLELSETKEKSGGIYFL